MAALLCSNFSPDIDPDTSTTTVISRGSIPPPPSGFPGDSVNMKYPGSLDGLCITTVIPTRPRANGRKSAKLPVRSVSGRTRRVPSSRSTRTRCVGENGSRNASPSSAVN